MLRARMGAGRWASRWQARGAAAAGGLLVGLVAAEGLGRLVPVDAGAALLYDAPAGTPPDMFQLDPWDRLVPNPGFDGSFVWLDHRVRVRFNRWSLRGADALPPAPRWLAAGDSFVLARQVDEADTFAALLGPHAGLAVLNGGVDGANTWDAVERYLAVDAAVGVEGLLLVVFTGNDPAQDAAPPRAPRRVDPFGPAPALPGPVAPADNRFAAFRRAHEAQPWWEEQLFQRSALWAWVRVARARAATGRVERLRWEQFRTELGLFSTSGAAARSQAVAATGAALRAARAAAEARGDRLLVAVAPPVFALSRAATADTLETFGLDPASAEPDALHEGVVAAGRAAGAAVCDLRPALRAASERGEQSYFRWEGHWTPHGHRVVAAALRDGLGGGGP